MTLSAARGLLNWTQEDLARETGISVSTINRIEAQKNSPSIDRCAEIVAALKRGGLVGLSLDSIAWSSASNARNSAAAVR
jgi:transcriptional regulator with XRE-family HTH domain